MNTDMRMRMARYSEYHYNNWENCPFQSQVEVSGVSQSSKETQFKIGGGIFFKDEQAGSIQKETHEQSEEL